MKGWLLSWYGLVLAAVVTFAFAASLSGGKEIRMTTQLLTESAGAVSESEPSPAPDPGVPYPVPDPGVPYPVPDPGEPAAVPEAD